MEVKLLTLLHRLLYTSSKGGDNMRPLSTFQKILIILYVVYVLWITVFQVPWILRFSKESPAETRGWAPVFKPPERAYYPFWRQEENVGYAHVDYKQIVTLLFTGTVVSGGLFVISASKKK